MAEPEGVSSVAPRELTLRMEDMSNPRFTPRELRLIKQATGRAWSQIMADETDDEKFPVLAWLKLRRDGYELELGEMDDVLISLEVSPPDPTNGQPPTISLPSADIGG